ncbi:MAG TPA: DUF885 domain-containing protein, partial [Rhodanobacteraceae bacterium]|nr:DUF885 domain-containing protein [Rhodanobacteraceae bacterium]
GRRNVRYGSWILRCVLLLVPVCGLAAAGHEKGSISAADAAFVRLADEFIDTYFLPNDPANATTVGVHAYDGKLQDFSRAGIDREVATLEAFEKRFAAIDPATLDGQTRGDRDLVLGTIRSRLLTRQTIRTWAKDPNLYSSAITNSAFVIMERKFAPVPDRLRALIAREKLMPAVLETARRNLKNPPEIYTEIALEQIGDLAAFFQKDVPAAFADVSDADLRKQFEAANSAVIKALNEYGLWLKSDLLPSSKGDYRLGEETYRKKLLYDEMVDTPLDKLIEIDLADLKRNQDEFARVAKSLEPDKTPLEVLADLSADYPEPSKLLDSFRATFDGLIKFINDKHIISIPSQVRPTLEETPPFMRATTFASMDTPGPLETVANEAYFNVTLPEASWPKERVTEFMAQFSYPVISNVAVHEAYPGHYIQFLWMHDVHDRVRKLFGATTNIEGWAHYCEQMMLDEGLAQSVFPNDERQQKLLKLGQLQDALLRNARFYVGIKLHTGAITFDQAVDFFVKEGYQSHAVGVVETKRGAGDPTYLYYTLGKIEILKLRADVQTRQGSAFKLQQFHDDFMRQGAAPIPIVRRALLPDAAATASH